MLKNRSRAGQNSLTLDGFNYTKETVSCYKHTILWREPKIWAKCWFLAAQCSFERVKRKFWWKLIIHDAIALSVKWKISFFEVYVTDNNASNTHGNFQLKWSFSYPPIMASASKCYCWENDVSKKRQINFYFHGRFTAESYSWERFFTCCPED